MKRAITTDQEAYIRKNYLMESCTDIGKRFGHPKGTIISALRRMGLVIPAELAEARRKEGMKNRHESEQNKPRLGDDFLKENYLSIPVKQMSREIGRSSTYTCNRMKILGLEVPKELRAERKVMTQIRPGNVSHNKGKKQADYMTPEGIANSKKTTFKKGQLPPNSIGVKDGDIRVRKDKRGVECKFIRVALGKWVALQRFVWEKEHGPIPDGMIIYFKNGNSMNCAIDNLGMMSKAENALRNSWTTNQPDEYFAFLLAGKQKDLRPFYLKQPDLIEIKRIQLQLNKVINERTSTQTASSPD